MSLQAVASSPSPNKNTTLPVEACAEKNKKTTSFSSTKEIAQASKTSTTSQYPDATTLKNKLTKKSGTSPPSTSGEMIGGMPSPMLLTDKTSRDGIPLR